LWQQAGYGTEWLFETLVYREAVGIVTNGQLTLFDPVEAKDLSPGTSHDPGSVAAVRICEAPGESAPRAAPLWWGRRTVTPGTWQIIDEERAS
jgi:hypothetical protein